MKRGGLSSGLILIILSSSLASCGLRFKVSCTENGYASAKEGQSYHWPDGTSLQFRFAEDIPESLQTSVKAAAREYNTTLEKTRIVFSSKFAPEQSGSTNQVSGDGINGIYLLSSEDWLFYKSNPGALAVTNNLYTSSEIIETDIFFLESSFVARVPSSEKSTATQLLARLEVFPAQLKNLFRRTSMMRNHMDPHEMQEHGLLAVTSNSQGVTSSGSLQTKAFAVHEFGHSLGRCHTTDSDSIMQPSISATEFRNKPMFSETDKEILAEKYELRE